MSLFFTLRTCVVCVMGVTPLLCAVCLFAIVCIVIACILMGFIAFWTLLINLLTYLLTYLLILMAQVLPGMQNKLSKSRDLALEPMG